MKIWSKVKQKWINNYQIIQKPNYLSIRDGEEILNKEEYELYYSSKLLDKFKKEIHDHDYFRSSLNNLYLVVYDNLCGWWMLEHVNAHSYFDTFENLDSTEGMIICHYNDRPELFMGDYWNKIETGKNAKNNYELYQIHVSKLPIINNKD